jgi:hypothetical protein
MLVSNECGEGTEFRRRMDEAFKCCHEYKITPVGPKPSGAKLAVQELQPRNDLQLEAEVTRIIDDIRRAEREKVIPLCCRDAFRRWLDEARRISHDARRVEADGCFFLSNVNHAWDSAATELNERVTTILETNMGGANLASIRAAVDSLIELCARLATTDDLAGIDDTALANSEPTDDYSTDPPNLNLIAVTPAEANSRHPEKSDVYHKAGSIPNWDDPPNEASGWYHRSFTGAEKTLADYILGESNARTSRFRQLRKLLVENPREYFGVDEGRALVRIFVKDQKKYSAANSRQIAAKNAKKPDE